MLEEDPRNRLLARGPRFRADAEVVRDIALSASGLLTDKLGGPSIFPPVPQNVLDFNFTYPPTGSRRKGRSDTVARSTFFANVRCPTRCCPTFDAPNGDLACARRPRSNTPLAALTSLNEPIFVEAAQALALRILREGGRDDAERADYAFRLCTARRPTTAEREALLNLLPRAEATGRRLADRVEVATGDPDKLLELPPGTTPQDAAAWTMAARVLLNLDETLTKR